MGIFETLLYINQYRKKYNSQNDKRNNKMQAGIAGHDVSQAGIERDSRAKTSGHSP